MADDTLLTDICGGFGHLAVSTWAPEIQWIIVSHAVEGSDKVGIGCLAAVNKTWQFIVESLTFRRIRVSLESQDQDGAHHFLSILTPARLAHLKELIVEVAWPFYLSAQPGRRFSAPAAVYRMNGTIVFLSRFITDLRRATTDSTPSGLNLVLKAIKPAFVIPNYNISNRMLYYRPRTPAEIQSSWLSSQMQKISPASNFRWSNKSTINIQALCVTLPIVTGLTFPPDFFHPLAIPTFLSRFPNLTIIELKPMCKMADPEGWYTNLFTSELTTAPYYPIGGQLCSALKISTLILGRNAIKDGDLFGHEPDLTDTWSVYGRHETDARLIPYVHAIRDYTKGLQKLIFDHFASETRFYVRFFADPLVTGFEWSNLEHVHINLHGDDVRHGKRVPMSIDHGAHLSPAGARSVLTLFAAAGVAVAKMPRLNKMTIHIPRDKPQRAFRHLLAVTLRFRMQNGRRDGHLAHGIWGSTGHLSFYACPHSDALVKVWIKSVALTGRRITQTRWYNAECPNPMDGLHYAPEQGFVR